MFIGKFLCPFFSLVMEKLPDVFRGDKCATFDCLLIMSSDNCSPSMAALVSRSFLSLG